MPEGLCHSLDQLALMQVENKADSGESLDCFKHVLKHFFLSITIHGYVVQVDDYGQGMAVWPTM